jgi:hypothetical protein
MTQKEMKMTFREFLKYHPSDYGKFEDTTSLSWREIEGDK